MNRLFLVLAIFFSLDGLVRAEALDASCMAGRDPAAIPANALKADPWVLPPQNAAEAEARRAELRDYYAPFLRSLPPKMDVRQRTSLDGEWRSKFESIQSVDSPLILPKPPDWFAPDLDDADWDAAIIPEWRWSCFQPNRKEWAQPWYPDSVILWYRKKFTAATAPPDKRIFLNFLGADWKAQVWLNGHFLGIHTGYFEGFRFDVTGILKATNCLAVRIISGPGYGQPISQNSVLPHAPADKGTNQVYHLRDRSNSIPDFRFGTSMSGGSGFGIHREVFLETVNDASVSEILVRGYPDNDQAKVIVETDAITNGTVTVETQILPENFSGADYRVAKEITIPAGKSQHEFTVAMPGMKWWWPAEPYLYRCRVILRAGKTVLDSQDALFGCRSVKLVSLAEAKPGLAEGQVLLNGQPIFLRGTSLTSVTDLAWYWGDYDRLVDVLLMTKVANFNAIRNNQHVAFPEVREVFDRLGILSQQEQGSGYEAASSRPKPEHLAEVCAPLAKVCYNNPGVILFSFMNEAHLDMTKPVAAVLKQDPERLLTPISGALFALRDSRYADQLLGCFHDYKPWYDGLQKLPEASRVLSPGATNLMALFHDSNPKPPASFFPIMRPNRLQLVGEYGAEALDNYETMKHYPSWWGTTPSLDEDKLWGAHQVNKGGDLRQEFGFRGRKPKNLRGYIEASQNYQADVLAAQTTSWRLSKQVMGGYYQFHFMDATPALWPKAIVGFDLAPKLGFFEMAQINQPIVPLCRLTERGAKLELWAANDLSLALPNAKLRWQITAADRKMDGDFAADLPARAAVQFGTVDLSVLPDAAQVLELKLTLLDNAGRCFSEYRHEIYRSFKEIDRAAEQEKLREKTKVKKTDPSFIAPTPHKQTM